MAETRKLIEVEFPLKETSLNSVHEKNMRHGHISTLHIWPARRPLAASRAALLTALLNAPTNEDGTINTDAAKAITQRIGGDICKEIQRKKMPDGRTEEIEVEVTRGGILHWVGNAKDKQKQQEKSRVTIEIATFREEIRRTYGRAPRVADVFAGGGAIPLEAMRLGCEVTAVDLNPVAWMLLKCTLEYPQQLAGQKLPLPDFALQNPNFLRAFLGETTRPRPTEKQLEKQLHLALDGMQETPDADLAWHVRAWGWWVLDRAKADLERFYPAVDNKPTIAYLWARTVKCRSCRATIPLLKTCWLCRKGKKRVLLHSEPEQTEERVPVFRIEEDVMTGGGNSAQKREHDRQLGKGTMSSAGVTCPCCRLTTEMSRLREEGVSGRLGAVLTAVVCLEKRLVAKSSTKGVVYREEEVKTYRLPTDEERRLAEEAACELDAVFVDVPFGIPDEQTPAPSGTKGDGSSLRLYGFDTWASVYTPRQLLALGTFVKYSRAAYANMHKFYDEQDCVKNATGNTNRNNWAEAIATYLAIAVDRLADRGSSLCHWDPGFEKIINTFQRFALQANWDYSEANPISEASGSYVGAMEWIGEVLDHVLDAESQAPTPYILHQSALQALNGEYDAIVTDPPYYAAIPYSDLMDFFYVWLRRTLHGLSSEIDTAFTQSHGPKWNHTTNDGELVDDPSRFGGDKTLSRQTYVQGMERAFKTCKEALTPQGHLVVVFANKSPEAWEALLESLIRAGFVVDASWPIQTEMGNRTRAHGSSALSSSVWLVCKPRPFARPGWDGAVLDEMRRKIRASLRHFWDTGIQGPDFVWAAVGPALESYSRYPFVRKANAQDEVLTVSEFLANVRRLVVEYAVGRLLEVEEADAIDVASGLDGITAYYLLHRKSFHMDDAPAGACILYALSCGLKENELVDRYELLKRSGGQNNSPSPRAGASDLVREDTLKYDFDETEPEYDIEEVQGTGSEFKLLSYNRRKRKNLGQDGVGGTPAPLVDQVHRLMQLHDLGDVNRLDAYVDKQGLARNGLLRKVMQAVRHLAEEERENEEVSLLDKLLRLLQERERTGTPTAQREVQGALDLMEA